jgi:hypothetical protein
LPVDRQKAAQLLPVIVKWKLDLKMLPRPTAANLLERVVAKAPASPIAEKLLTIVRELLENLGFKPPRALFLCPKQVPSAAETGSS